MDSTIMTLLAAASGYILKAVAESKAAHTAKEELLGGFWNWIRPLFIKDIPDIEEQQDDPEIAAKVFDKLVELVKNQDFYTELRQRVLQLQGNGIKAKNIVLGDIRRVKKIRIGDQAYSPDDRYDLKNIVKGSVEDAEEFRLGDGH